MSASFLKVRDVAERYGKSARWVHEQTRRRAIPFRQLPGCRECLFREDELQRWEDGDYSDLDVKEGRGVVVRLVPAKHDWY